MSLRPFDPQVALFCAVQTHELFAGDDRYRLFAQHIYPLLVGARAKLASAYCLDNGRPGIDPVLLLGVTLLQFMEGVPDRSALEQLRYHAGWNFALGRNLGEALFDPSVLSYFRERLLAHQQSALVFGQIIEGLLQAGLLKSRSRQRLDSTHVLGLVRQMSRLECVRQSLRLALEQLWTRAEQFGKPQWWQQSWERYVDSKLDYHTEPAVLEQKMVQAGQDARQLLAWVASLSDSRLSKDTQVQLLERVLAEQFEWISGPVSRACLPPGAVVDPHEPQAQWSAKGRGKQKKEWIGYKVQVVESVEIEPLAKGEPTRNFLLGLETQPAISSDQSGAQQIQQAQALLGLEQPTELYVDAAYVTAEELARAADQGRQLIGPIRHQPGKAGKFAVEDFTVDIAQRKALCPAGNPNTQCSRLQLATGELKYRFEWTTHCKACPLRDQCVNPKQTHRSFEVGEHHNYLQARRREQQTEAFQKNCQRRNGIEATVSELVRQHGLRRARYRGQAKVGLQNYFIGAACNAKRWIKRIIWELHQAKLGARVSLASG